MRKFKVIALSVGGRSRVFDHKDIVTEDQLPVGHANKLVEGGFLEEVFEEETSPEEEATPPDEEEETPVEEPEQEEPEVIDQPAPEEEATPEAPKEGSILDQVAEASGRNKPKNTRK